MSENPKNSEARELLRRTREYAAENHIPVMKTDTENKLVEVLARIDAKEILEIGAAVGYSGMVMLSVCENAALNTIEFDEERIKLAKANFAKTGLSDRVTIFCGDAKKIIPQLTGEYDFIFMDGPKGQYIDFLPHLLKVLRVNGILFCDNVGYMGLTQIADTLPKRHKHITIARNMAEFLKKIENDENLDTEVFFEIGDGVSVSKKLN